MKRCTQCGAENEDDNFTCIECGEENFKRVRSGGEISQPADLPFRPERASPSPPKIKRPNGSSTYGLAWFFFGLALVAAMIGISWEIDTDYISSGSIYLRGGYEPDVEDIIGRIACFAIAGASLQVSILCFVAGSIIRALWFIHGDDNKAE